MSGDARTTCPECGSRCLIEVDFGLVDCASCGIWFDLESTIGEHLKDALDGFIETLEDEVHPVWVGLGLGRFKAVKMTPGEALDDWFMHEATGDVRDGMARHGDHAWHIMGRPES